MASVVFIFAGRGVLVDLFKILVDKLITICYIFFGESSGDRIRSPSPKPIANDFLDTSQGILEQFYDLRRLYKLAIYLSGLYRLHYRSVWGIHPLYKVIIQLERC